MNSHNSNSYDPVILIISSCHLAFLDHFRPWLPRSFDTFFHESRIVLSFSLGKCQVYLECSLHKKHTFPQTNEILM